MLNDDLILRLRTACSPESPLGKLCSEAADTLAGVTDDYLRRHNDAVDRAEEIIVLKSHLKEAEELLKPFAAIGKNLPANRWPTDDEWQRLVKVHIADLRAAARFLQSQGGEVVRLGQNQLRLLRSVGTTAAVVVPDRETRRLCQLGLMASSDADGSFAHITPAGLRALANAAEAGRITLFVMPKTRQPKGESDE